MNLYMKQRVFSVTQDFDIYDEHGNVMFTVQGEFFTLGRKLHIYSAQSRKEVASVHQRLLTFLPTFDIYAEGNRIAVIKKALTFVKPKFVVEEIGWQIVGDFLAHDYVIYDQFSHRIAQIHKKYLSWSDTFEIIISPSTNDVHVIAVILAIDTVLDTTCRRY